MSSTLVSLPNLTELDLWSQNLEELQDPKPMKNITHLTLDGDPLEVSQKWKKKYLKILLLTRKVYSTVTTADMHTLARG